MVKEPRLDLPATGGLEGRLGPGSTVILVHGGQEVTVKVTDVVVRSETFEGIVLKVGTARARPGGLVVGELIRFARRFVWRAG